jgi:hypothetical protein
LLAQGDVSKFRRVGQGLPDFAAVFRLKYQMAVSEKALVDFVTRRQRRFVVALLFGSQAISGEFFAGGVGAATVPLNHSQAPI